MANHKKEWSFHDEVIRKLEFPHVPADKVFVPLKSDNNIIGGKKQERSPFNYQCPDCWAYFENEHICTK